MANGVPINSLQDLLLLRELRDQADPFKSGMKALAQGVASGIESQREEAKAKKKKAEQFDESLKKIADFNATNTSKIGDLQARTKLKADGTLELTAETETFSQKAQRRKAETETKLLTGQAEAKRSFNAPGSTDTVQDLINAGVKASEAKTIEELRGTIAPTRQLLVDSFNTGGGNIDITSGTTDILIPKTAKSSLEETKDLGTAIPSRTAQGRAEKIIDLGDKTRVETAAANVQISKEVNSQMEKAGELAKRGVQRASGASNTAMSEVLRFNKENLDEFGFKPGFGFGLVENLLPEQLNRYKASAKGASREAAATVGTQIIPAARAVRMVEIFAKSTAEVGNTVEGNAANTGASMSNVWGNALSSNFPIELKDGTTVRIKDLVKDPLTGRPLSDFQFPEIFDAISRATEDFKLKTEQNYLEQAFDLDPNLLSPSTRDEMSDIKKLRRIEELRSRQ